MVVKILLQVWLVKQEVKAVMNKQKVFPVKYKVIWMNVLNLKEKQIWQLEVKLIQALLV